MQINITGKQMEVGQALQTHVKDRLTHSVKKYFENAISSEVVFSKRGVFFRADIMVNEGTGQDLIIRANAESDDAHVAFDMAMVRVEKQLRKYKEKIKNHRKTSLHDVMQNDEMAKKFVIQAETEELVEDNPVIIAEKATNLKSLSVSEAVMEMDLKQLPALMFRNKMNSRLNVVYYRADGNISWVDPEKN